MDITQSRLIEIRVTPKQLREMADNMERRFNMSMCGDPTPRFERWSKEYSVKIEFVFDQSEHDRETKR
jgi:hypothetical protein